MVAELTHSVKGEAAQLKLVNIFPDRHLAVGNKRCNISRPRRLATPRGLFFCRWVPLGVQRWFEGGLKMGFAHPQIAVNTEAEALDARAEVKAVNLSHLSKEEERKDYFVRRDGLCYAGSHLIIDLWQADNLTDLEIIETALREAIDAAGATLLHLHLHEFEPNGGVSGVAVLAESHISIHTWPERAYAALDVFMCGDADPSKTIPVLRRYFGPGMVSLSEHKRGVF